MIGKTYKHMHCLEYYCQILEPTKRGFKVMQYELRRSKKMTFHAKTAFYDTSDFTNRPLWTSCEKMPPQILLMMAEQDNKKEESRKNEDTQTSMF